MWIFLTSKYLINAPFHILTVFLNVLFSSARILMVEIGSLGPFWFFKLVTVSHSSDQRNRRLPETLNLAAPRSLEEEKWEWDLRSSFKVYHYYHHLFRCKIPPVMTPLTSRRLRWLEHVTGNDYSNIPKLILYGELMAGSRSRSGPQLRCRDIWPWDCSINQAIWEELVITWSSEAEIDSA